MERKNTEPVKILMVCLGNICRSPVAEGIMLKLIEERKLNIIVDSAGTAGYHVDEAPDTRTVRNAKKNGVDLSKLRARKFETQDFDRFDKIYVMDAGNFQSLKSMSSHVTHLQKVDFLLNEIFPGQDAHVPNPY